MPLNKIRLKIKGATGANQGLMPLQRLFSRAVRATDAVPDAVIGLGTLAKTVAAN